MWQARAILAGFGALLLWLAIGVLGIAHQAVALRWFGTAAEGRVVDVYMQGGDDAGGPFIAFDYRVSGREYRAVAGAPRHARVGDAVAIVYLPWSPGVSNTASEVRLGGILGPVALLPVGLILAGTGVWLLIKSVSASRAELDRPVDPD